MKECKTFLKQLEMEKQNVERDGRKREEQIWRDAGRETQIKIERAGGRYRSREGEKVGDSRTKIAGPVLSEAK